MKKTFVEVICVGVPKVLKGVLSLGLNLVLLRYLTTKEFGIFSLCICGISVADTVFGNPFDMSILRLSPPAGRQQNSQPLAIERISLKLKLTIGAVIVGGLTILSKPLSAQLFELEGTWRLIPISGCAVLAMMLLRSLLVHLQVNHRFNAYGCTDLLHVLTTYIGIGAYLIWQNPSISWLLSFFALGPLFAVFVTQFSLVRRLVRFSTAGMSMGVAPRRELNSFVQWYMATSFLGAVVARMDIFCLGWFLESDEVGLFAAGQLLASIPWILGSYLGIVTAPRIIPKCHDGTFGRFFTVFQLTFIFIAIVSYFLVYGGWNILAPLVLPPDFVDSGQVFMILLPGSLAAMVTFPLTLPFVMFRKRRFLVMMDSISLPLLALIYIIVIPRYGVLGAAWVTSAATFIRSILANVMAWSLIHGVSQWIKDEGV